MPLRSRAPVVAGVAAALVALPGAAQAATPTKTIDMGTPIAAQKTLQKYSADVNDFFPHSLTVNVGQKVKFVPTGFHTVDFAPRGGNGVDLLTPQSPISGANDAAGNAYWFNGQMNLGFNPALFPPGLFGKNAKYTGAKRVESGLPLANKPKPFTVAFTKAGTYTYLCDVHPGMKGVVHVVAKGKKVPSAKQDGKAVARQVAAALKTAKKLAATKPPAGTVDVGSAGPHGVESFAFYPSTISVPSGTTLNFRMTPGSFEIHTATTGPGDPDKADTFLGKLVASTQSPTFDPAAIYPSDAPGPPASLSTTSHGNGFWNSGALDTSNTTPQVPASNSVTFAQAGTYQFYCLIHPFMHGTVNVT